MKSLFSKKCMNRNWTLTASEWHLELVEFEPDKPSVGLLFVSLFLQKAKKGFSGWNNLGLALPKLKHMQVSKELGCFSYRLNMGGGRIQEVPTNPR